MWRSTYPSGRLMLLLGAAHIVATASGHVLKQVGGVDGLSHRGRHEFYGASMADYYLAAEGLHRTRPREKGHQSGRDEPRGDDHSEQEGEGEGPDQSGDSHADPAPAQEEAAHHDEGHNSESSDGHEDHDDAEHHEGGHHAESSDGHADHPPGVGSDGHAGHAPADDDAAHDEGGHAAIGDDHDHEDEHHDDHAHGHHGEHDSGHGHGQGHSDSGHGHGHGQGHTQGAHSVAVGLVATVILVPLVVSMALSNGKVHELTMKLLDTFTSIFLAVLWFNTFRQFMKTMKVGDLFPYAQQVFALVQIIGLYMIANAVAWMWRDNNMRLTTFCACGAHVIAFAGIHFGAESQHAAAEWTGDYFDDISVWGLVVATGVFLGAMFVTNYFLWRARSTNQKLQHAINELELDVTGLVISFVVTQAVRHALTGSYPALHLFLMQGMVLQEGHHVTHEPWQRWFMLGWSTSLMGLSVFALPRLNALSKRHAHDVQSSFFSAKAAVHMTKVVLIMLIAWGFLLWAEWEFYDHIFRGDVMFGHMVFAVLATLVCLGVLYLIAYNEREDPSPEMRQTESIITTGISLICAWSWEHCFNLAFNIIGQEYQVGYEGLVPKIVLSIVVPLCLWPTYVSYVRTRVLEIEEMHGGHSPQATPRSPRAETA